MGSVEEKLARLRSFTQSVRAEDPELAEESLDIGGGPALESMSVGGDPEDELALESIIMRRERPVLAIKKNAAELVFADAADSKIWKKRIEDAKPHLDKAIRAVGRVELKGGPLEWVGTGWLVHENIIVTNRHVANEFARRDGQGFSFRMGDDGPIEAAVDFLEEIDNEETLLFRLLKPLYIEQSPGPDAAFFEVERMSGKAALAKPIALAAKPRKTESVAVIGYPAFDSRIPEPDLMERIYGKIYNKKRLAPGGVTKLDETRIFHNATTLGGNSGSLVMDLATGEALGLHFSGSFLTTNYGVRSDVVARLLEKVRSGKTSVEVPSSPAVSPPPPPPAQPQAAAAGSGQVAGQFTIPLTVTVTVGEPTQAGAAARPGAKFQAGGGAGDVEDGEEAVAADYRDREGYMPDFLGVEVPLPEIKRGRRDILEFDYLGKTETELRYQHYSVVMSESRRMPFFSAVNIDGKLARKSKRVAWKWDPRIPRKQQIMNECYGSPPRFSRGHMTRREDPGWGDEVTAKRGNEDSMHVTNVAPQMQAFNAPIWLALEDYALGNAREDAMKISVFTGPYFDPDDPTMYGVRIPIAFWKIIAFIHDETGELSATGYEMDQSGTLVPEEEFVFGAFTSPQLGIATQVPIHRIASRSGIDFGNLASHDPLASVTESIFGGEPPPALASLEQIRFR